MDKNLPKMMGFEAEGAAAIVKGERIMYPETLATAIRIGNPASWKYAEAARDESNGMINFVTDDEIVAAYKLIASSKGVLAEPASAASVAGLIKVKDQIKSGSKIVCILTGNGLKDPDNAIKYGNADVKKTSSELNDILKAMKEGKKVIAMIAPAIAGQFPGNIYQLKSAIKKAGFTDVYEVAQGADITAHNEAEEFLERMEAAHDEANKWLDEWVNEGGYDATEHEGEEEHKVQNFMTTSCCPAYVKATKVHVPEIEKFVSHTGSPMRYIAEIARQRFADAKIVFVGPCLGKRIEAENDPNVDYVLVFQDILAMFNAKGIDINSLEADSMEDETSLQSRRYAISGGVAGAVANLVEGKAEYKPFAINGLIKDVVNAVKIPVMKPIKKIIANFKKRMYN